MKSIKPIAFYLPQYHRVPENDEWWGEGFTDWMAVKAAERYADNQYQPREPLNDNYYDLAQKESMQWQADLACEYGVGGFCMYHYYFKDGRKILEKPLENFLRWTDIDIPFCLCWANETWARTWSNLYHNTPWAEKFEKRNDKGQTILLEQSYGGKEEWEKHFEYLLPFFCDSRYIKVDNKPVFLFYRPDDITQLDGMIQLWSELLCQKGFNGLYAIGVNIPVKKSGLDAILYHAVWAYTRPDITGMALKKEYYGEVSAYDYQEAWDNVIKAQEAEGIKTYFGGFVDQDETPRRGKKGWYLIDATPQKFEKNLYDLAIKNLSMENEFLFIDAWNEWGEGNYLEPDKKFEYQYLSAVKNVVEKCNMNELDIANEWKKIKKRRGVSDNDTEKMILKKELNKYQSYYKIFDRWLSLKEEGRTVDKYFKDYNYKKVLIYGYASTGIHFCKELRKTSVQIVGAMDRRQGLLSRDLPIFGLSDPMPDCDVIVVTLAADFEIIMNDLRKKTDKPIVSMEEVLFY